MDGKQKAIAGKWESLKPALSKQTLSVLSNLGFDSMTPVQAAAIPLFLQNKDVVVEAVTGSGKTLAFVIPIIEILAKRTTKLNKYEVGAVIIEPTRELAVQVSQVLETFLESRKLNQMALIGGTSVVEDVTKFKSQGASIIVGTPGRIDDILSKVKFIVLRELEVLVLDEADRLLDMGFENTLNSITTKLPKQRRTGLFSATMTDGLHKLVRAGLRNPVRVVVKVENTKTKGEQRTPAMLDNFYMICGIEEKLDQLIKFLEDKKDQKMILYFPTCFCVDYFYRVIHTFPSLSNFPIFSLHGKVPQDKRTKIYSKFTSSSNGMLVCTDVAARGLDIPDVDWVIQFDPPQGPSSFVHRCGRTARSGRAGRALVFLQPQEDAYIEFMKLRKVPMSEMPTIPVEEKSSIYPHMKKIILKDREMLDKSIRAFVSYIRFYKEHECNYIFRFKDLDLSQVAKCFMIVKVPKMPELKNVKIDLPVQVDESVIKYKNKAQEENRVSGKDKEKKDAKKKRPTSTIPWSNKIEQKLKKKKRKEIKIAKKEYLKRTREESGDTQPDTKKIKSEK